MKILRAKYRSTHGDPPIETEFECQWDGTIHWGDRIYEWDEGLNQYVCGEYTLAFHDGDLTYVINYDPPPPALGTTVPGTWVMSGPLDPQVE